MRRAPRLVPSYPAIASGALALGLALAAAGAAGAVTVPIDQSQIVDLSAPAGNVMIGNPAIADVTLINPRRMAVFGHGYGVTNLIVTDRMGRIIMQQQIEVGPGNVGRVSVYRGATVNTFSCSPRCERTPMPGEDKGSYEAYSAPFKDYTDRARADTGQTSASN